MSKIHYVRNFQGTHKVFFKRRGYPKDLFKIKVQLLECKTKIHSKAPLFKQTQIKLRRSFFH